MFASIKQASITKQLFKYLGRPLKVTPDTSSPSTEQIVWVALNYSCPDSPTIVGAFTSSQETYAYCEEILAETYRGKGSDEEIQDIIKVWPCVLNEKMFGQGIKPSRKYTDPS